MSVDTQVAEINKTYKELYDSVKEAIGELSAFSRGFTDVYYQFGQSNLQYVYADTDYIPIKAIKTADNMITTIKTLADKIGTIKYVPPPEIDGTFKMEKTRVWESDFANQISNSLSDYMTSMGIPAKEFQDAIFNEDYERKKIILEDLYDLADSKAGARGFTYPNSMITALKLDAQTKYQYDRNQTSRDILKLVTEWARQNYQFSIEKGLTLEAFHSDFTYKYCTAFVDIYKNLVLASVERFKAEIAASAEPIMALIEAAKLPVEVDKINADISKENATLDIEQRKMKISEIMENYKARLQYAIQQFQLQINGLDSAAKQTGLFAQSVSRSYIGIDKN